ncbi:MAG: SDR family oxidoreductase [Oscillospiraceae bacterium]|nr:SDR family oxidoreductase [Oscillospiraceae bacterium]
MITKNMFEECKVFDGKVVVITGGSRGIGFAAVKEFLKAGAKVCFLSHYEETGKAALAKLAEIDPNYPVIWRCIDLCSEEQAKALFEEVEALWGRVDVLINNAGISNDDALVHHTKDRWQAVLDVNMTAVYNMSRYAISALKKTEGCIINTSSVSGVYGSPSGIAYPATKSAVMTMTKTIAYALAPVGIRCNAIAPGVTHTEIIDNLPQFALDSIGGTIPLKRSNHPAMARTEDIAYSMMFLASDYAEYITGATLQVDAGYRPSNMHQFVDWGEEARH